MSGDSINQNLHDATNELIDLLSGMQGRRINADAVEVAGAKGVEDGDGGADAMDGGAAHVVVDADVALHVIGVVGDGVLEDGEERGPERGGGGEGRVVDGFGHEEVEIGHVGEVFVALLVV